MKKRISLLPFLALWAFLVAGCAGSAARGPEAALTAGNPEAAIVPGTAEWRADPSRALGRGVSIAVLPPEGVNLAGADAYLPPFVQGRLNTLFRQYSVMTIADRQQLDRVLAEQQLAADEAFSDKDFVSIGNLTSARFLLTGSIIRMTGRDFSLELGIANAETGERLRTFTKNCAEGELRDGRVINEAALDFLAFLGVELTGEEQGIILAARVEAEGDAALARAIIAQRSGSVIWNIGGEILRQSKAGAPESLTAFQKTRKKRSLK
jgi:hypothetical protein